MAKKLLESLPEFASDLSQEQYNEILSALEAFSAQKKSCEDLQKRLDELTEESKQKDLVIEEQAKSLAELQEAGPSVSVEVPSVEVNGVEYAVAGKKFKLLGDSTSYSAEDVLASEELQKRILAVEGQTILIPVQ